MSIGKIVLDDNLLLAYLKGDKTRKYKKLMRKYIYPHATNFRQLTNIMKISGDLPELRPLLSQMANDAYSNYDLPSLALETIFKIILTDDSNKRFPYVHYEDAVVNNRLTFHLSPTDDRVNLKSHLQRLCENANKITICDNYFASNWTYTSSLFLSIFPKKTLEIEFAETMPNTSSTLNSDNITPQFASSICAHWSVALTSHIKYQNCHDRYLLIESPDSKIEVMLSSGFSHVWQPKPKEITCVFSEVL
ncbi:hypothetical protein [Pectobacterium aroidearum]|uniref:hypothetical protein n=1 Tax=Pectobacterium aroidearum TaxID=1201031 RepID=UPI002A831D47|nr:hypothetical protein [Pectobacterium aroidearum]MDY4388101.1 hypothetical protein [Pectobacterium aroidearum]